MAIRTIEVRERVLARNEEIAERVKHRLDQGGVTGINLISSPGSGKTSLLERTLDLAGDALSIAVVTGDVQTTNDAERLERHTDSLVHAVVTGGACHLDARQVEESLNGLNLADIDILIVENVGNLVCPAAWRVGESFTAVLFSVTEGEDKPLKYPAAFRCADLLVLTKIDLLPYLSFDCNLAVANAHQVNPGLEVVRTSARSGEGMTDWLDALRRRAALPGAVR